MSVNVETVGQRVEGLLDQIGRSSPKAADLAEDLVRELMSLYGAGIQRLLERLQSADPGAAADLTADPLIAGLMALHGLHPVDLPTRVNQALEQVRPYMGSHGGGVSLLGIEGDVVRLELEGSCDGCGSSAVTVQYAVEGAIRDAAPEIATVEVINVEPPAAAPNLISADSLRRRPGDAPAEQQDWIDLDIPASVAPGQMTGQSVDGIDLVLLERDGQLLAYRDACARCRASLLDGAIDGDALRCPSCGQRYDVRLAGRAIDDGEDHAAGTPSGEQIALAPVPLMATGGTTRVAVGALR